jgi:hypothetical protein
MAKLTLKVNGTNREVESDDPDIPLLYVLRGDLGLTGTHFGCGLVQCGACSAPGKIANTFAVELIQRLDQPPLGAGEAASTPVGAALANAVFDATGVRLRTVPFRADRVKAALAGRS